jgi:negative regulator of flagellin synthesis FlgM
MSSIPQLSGPERLRTTAGASALRNNARNTSSAPTVSRQPDDVSISAAGRSLSTARGAVLTAPETRTNRLDALKAAIADGSYSVDSRRLATAMVRSSDR